MRSRYSAFCTQAFEYILQTCVNQPDTAELESEAEKLKQDYQGIAWLKLKILESGDGVNGEDANSEKAEPGEKANEGKVHFKAFYGIKGKVYALEENSTFWRISTELSRSKASGLIIQNKNIQDKSNQDKNSEDKSNQDKSNQDKSHSIENDENKSSQNNNTDSGQWLYHANQSQSTMQRVKLSRNDECICGSGNKFKKCCERLIR